MHLFNIAHFGDRFGIDVTVPDFYNAIAGASRAATADLASLLRFKTFAAYGRRRDLFFVDRMFDRFNGSNRQFNLSRGFVSAATLTAHYAPSPLNLRNADGDLITDLRDVNEDGRSDHVFLDAHMGLLSVFGVDISRQWVMITYEGGLSVASDDTFDEVPDWLAEAAMAKAALDLLEYNRQFKPDGGMDLSDLKGTVTRTFQTLSRYAPGALAPTASEDAP